MELEEIQKLLEKTIPNCAFKQFYIKSLNDTLLCVYFDGLYHRIQLHNKKNGTNSIAKIDYAFNGNFCYIDLFQTALPYQGLGLGKFIFNLALAHADKSEFTEVSGQVYPINGIKGCKNDFFDIADQTKALIEIYKKLGSNIVGSADSEAPIFKLNWKEGQRYNLLNDEEKAFIDNIIEINNISRIGL